MKLKGNFTIPAAVALGAVAVFIFFATQSAYAYPIGTGTGANTSVGQSSTLNIQSGLNSLYAPFNNFFQSMRLSSDSNRVSISIDLPPQISSRLPGGSTAGLARYMDNWVAMNVGLRPSTIYFKTTAWLLTPLTTWTNIVRTWTRS